MDRSQLRARVCGKPPRCTCVVVFRGVGVFSRIKNPSRFLGNLMQLNNAFLRSEARNSSRHKLVHFNQKHSSEDSYSRGGWNISLETSLVQWTFSESSAWLPEQGWFPGRPCQIHRSKADLPQGTSLKRDVISKPCQPFWDFFISAIHSGRCPSSSAS